MKANAELYLDTRPKADGLCNVKVRVYFNRKYMYYSTDIDLKPGKKDENGKEIEKSELEKILTAKRRATKQKEIYSKLNTYLKKAEDTIKKLDTAFTFEKFDEVYHEGRDVFNSALHAFDKYITDLKAEGRISTAINYRASINSLEDFKKNLKFTDITPSFLKKYERWMLDNGKSTTTVGIYLRSLRAIFNQQDIDRKLYPFGHGKYEIPSGKNIKKALTIEEIARIYNYEATGSEAMARDYWMFLYLCNGMNVKDFCSLKWENIDGDTLTYQREKTKRTRKDAKKITVSLKPETWEIINKYGIRSVVPGSYIFPHYEKGITETRKQEVSQQLIKTINKYMKRVANNVGINKNVTTYFARHSFATILKRSGTDIAMISDLLGHSNLGVTESYLDSFESDQIKKQTEREPLTPPQPEVDPDKVEIINNFNGNDIKEVIEHFKSLERNMNDGEFMQWIKQAFELQKPPERKFILKGNLKIKDVAMLFVKYWIHFGKKHGAKPKYIKLLCDYFEGYEYDNIYTNYSKVEY